MLQTIKVNLNALEGMLYLWQCFAEKEKVSENFLNDLALMPEFTVYFDEEFTAESFRKVLSAITNREPFKGNNKKEGRFWNYNMWITEDMEYTKAMIAPLKKLNLENLVDEFKNNFQFKELEVIFTPMHLDEYIIKDNKIIINFFKVKPGDFDDNTYIGDVEINDYIKKLINNMIQPI